MVKGFLNPLFQLEKHEPSSIPALNLVLRRFTATERNVVPEPLVHEIKRHLQQHIECARTQRDGHIAAEIKHHQRRPCRSQYAVANRLRQAAGIRIGHPLSSSSNCTTSS